MSSRRNETGIKVPSGNYQHFRPDIQPQDKAVIITFPNSQETHTFAIDVPYGFKDGFFSKTRLFGTSIEYNGKHFRNVGIAEDNVTYKLSGTSFPNRGPMFENEIVFKIDHDKQQFVIEQNGNF